MAEKDKRYYWLKLKRDFFKRHDISIIEALPDGKEAVLFYLKLLCESVDHDGRLRFSDTIPYTTEMLATITKTDVKVAENAVKLFRDLDMLEILEDGTFYMKEVSNMIGSETYWAEKKRQKREEVQQELEKVEKMSTEVGQSPTCPSKSKSQSKSKNNNISSNEDISAQQEQKHRYGEFKRVLLTDKEYYRLITDFGKDKTEKAIKFLDEYMAEKPYRSKSHYLALRRWVFKAVEEQERRRGAPRHGTAEELDEFYKMAADWAAGGEGIE